ncbi:MAG: hypothetical protein N2Z69_04065 [Methylophilaceae bacterium]|nr:hypothetical protein [Methylophilaceae bacterium]
MRVDQLMQFHEDPRVIAWWQVRFGGMLAWLTPFRRRIILATGAVWVMVKELRSLIGTDDLAMPVEGRGVVLAGLVLLGLAWLFYRAAAGFASLPAWIRQHPQLALHGVYWGFLGLAWLSTPAMGVWQQVLLVVALVFPFLVWRFGYMLLMAQYGRMAGTRFYDHFLTFWPVYGGSNTPYGKGMGYLSRCEAKNAEELARSQLAGIKLLILSGLWNVTLDLMEALFYGPGNALTARLGGYTVGIPKLSQLVADEGAGTAFWISWISVYCELIYQVLRHAVRGHQIVAVLRIFGFNVFRNTYKPLLSESIVEFWNRYYYYFKELMANFFFLPTFAQLGSRLRNWPRVRLFAAVFAAAFVGNMYYHLIKMNELMVQGHVLDGLYELRSRFFYCFLLALGIYISMLREQRRAGQPATPGRLRRFLRIAGVWTFFGLIFIWNVKGGASFTARVNFFLSLFGLAPAA